MRKIGDKRGEASFDNIILLILGVLVILGALSFVFRNEIRQYIKNLPGYEGDMQDKEVRVIDSDVKSAEKNCEIIGRILAAKDGKQYIYLNSLNGETKLYWYNDRSIRWSVNWKIDPEVAKVQDGTIIVDLAFLNDEEYRGRYTGIPSVSDLEKLNRAKKIENNYICK